MAKLSSYTKDTSITEKDKLAGSSYVGLVNGIPKYQTSSYTIEDLSKYFSENIFIGGSEYDIVSMYNNIQDNITSIASISTSLTVLANEDLALAQSITTLETQFTTDLSDAVSSINITLTSLSTADLALAQSITTLETSFTTDLTEAVSSINVTLTSLSTADLALAQSITTLETSFTTDLTDAVATINTSLTALSTADSALATSITELETSFTTDLSEAVATINTELTTLSTADLALATSITELETSFTTDLSDAVATINTELTTLSTADEALATSITELETSFETDLTDAVAAINTELTTLSTADAALATSITELETSFTTDLTDAVAAINTELTTLSTADEALATSITELETSFTTDLTDAIATINTELTTLSTADLALASSITELETSFETDLSDAVATINTELNTLTTADLALASSVTGLETSFTTDLTNAVSAINTELNTLTNANESLANSVDSLGAAFGTFDGETFSISEAKITEELNTYTGLNFSESTYFQNIESNISGKPSVYRQDGEPTISAGPPQAPANGSIWYDTNDSNKVYILTAGVWTLTDDSRIGANASKVTNMSAAFGTFDENNNFTIDGDASYGEAIILKVDTDSATAAKIENLGAELGVFDGNNNFATSFSADFKTAVNNEVDANSSTAGYVSNLSAAVGIDKEDGSTLQASASVNGNNTGTTTTATVDVAVEGSKTIQLVDNISNELIEVGQYVTFESSTWLYAVDDVWRVAEYSDATNIVVLDKEVSLGEGDTLIFKGKSVIAVDGVSGVIREGFQVRGEGITVGTFVSDYTVPNLTLSRAEVLADNTVLEFLGIYAAVTETAKVLADIDGNLKASWGMQVDANGNIAGMKLLADNTGSGIIFNADTFKIYNSTDTTGVAPFEVKDGTVKIKSANIGDISFGDLDDIPDTFISTVIYADDINGTNPSTTKGSKNFFAIYQANVAWEDGDALPEGLTFSQMKGDTGEQGLPGEQGEPGETGATGFRVYNTNLYYQSVVTDNTTPTFDDSGLEYNFSTNSFGSTIPSGWAINPPSTAPGSGSNKYYYVPINIIEGTPNQIVVGAVTSYFNFSGLVTFTGGGTTISDGENEFDYTAIDGAWITTGAIKSQNFEYTDTNSSLSFNESETVTDGTIFNLVDGYLKTPTLWLKSNGDALFTGDISGATGTFTGKLFAGLGANSVVNPNSYVAFGNVEVSNVGETITKNFPVLELSDDFHTIQARRAIYINTLTDDPSAFTGIRFFGTRLDENGDEDLANKGLSIKADEIELRYFNHPDAYVPTKFKWADKSIIDGPTWKTEIYADYNSDDKPYIVIDADVRFQGDVDLGTGQIVGHPIINASTSSSNAAGTSTVIKNISFDNYGHALSTDSISLTLDNITDAGNTTDNNIYVNNVIADAVAFRPYSPEAALQVGGATWNIEKGTLNLHVKEGTYYRIGQQTFFFGKATEAISKGQVVMFAGVQGSHVLLAKADMSATGFIPEYVIGVAAEDFVTNEYGHVVEFGELIGFDTTDFEAGDLLYLDPATPGGYVTTEPDSSDGHSILIAAVINTQNATNGGIIVRPSHKVGIDELHDVDVTGKTAGDMLVYNDVDEKWVAKNELTDLKLYGQLTGPATFIIDPAIVDSDEGTVEIRGSIDVKGNGNFDGNVVIDGDLTVSGATVTISATNLAVQDNMIYLNQGSTVSNPDLGFSGNYNDGDYAHAGLFRDATDGIWKFFKNYVPEPDDSVYINTAHETFALADVQAASFTGDLNGNVIGNVEGNLQGTASNATNADKVDDKHATDFTLDYVISNNHVTTRDVTMADISADNIDLGGSLVVDGTINGKTTIKGDFNSLNTTGFVIAKLAVSGTINNELFTITVFGTGYYQKTVFSCTHPGTPTTDWSTWISINEGDDIFLISPSNVNNELVLTLKASQVISDLGGSYFIEHIGNELIKV